MTVALNNRSAPELILPWTPIEEEDERYNKILIRTLILLLLLCLIGPWLPLPEISREEAEKVPPRLARVVLEKKQAPKPPPPPQQEQQEPETAQQKKPMDKKTVAARKKASTVGVAAFSKQLSSLRSSLNVAQLKAKNTTRSTGAAKKNTRSLLGKTSADATSGGVQTAALSANAGGSKLAGHSSTSVDSPIAGIGGELGSGKSYRSKKKSTGRDAESIRRVMEREKGAIYSMYSRALRKDPELEGKYVFKMVIQPDGSISSVTLVSSELGDPALERKMLARIRRINFGAIDGAAATVNYQFDFIPS